MWWLETRHGRARLLRLGAVAGLALSLAGCFEPLYGEKTLGGGTGLRNRLASVDVLPIVASAGTSTARIAVEVQNDLNFDLTGGAGNFGKTHQLRINLSAQNQQVIVDITTARPEVQQFGLNATYTLVEIATGKAVVSGTSQARVSYDNPGQQQRFASARGQRDAENRAAKQLSDQIRSRLASYFAAGA